MTHRCRCGALISSNFHQCLLCAEGRTQMKPYVIVELRTKHVFLLFRTSDGAQLALQQGNVVNWSSTKENLLPHDRARGFLDEDYARRFMQEIALNEWATDPNNGESLPEFEYRDGESKVLAG